MFRDVPGCSMFRILSTAQSFCNVVRLWLRKRHGLHCSKPQIGFTSRSETVESCFNNLSRLTHVITLLPLTKFMPWYPRCTLNTEIWTTASLSKHRFLFNSSASSMYRLHSKLLSKVESREKPNSDEEWVPDISDLSWSTYFSTTSISSTTQNLSALKIKYWL